MPRFLLTTFGSLGDLHPYIAVGLGLKSRGHHVTIATSADYRAKVEGEGLDFHPLRPEIGALVRDPEEIARAFHPRTGTEYVIRRMMLPYLEQSWDDLLPIAREADLIVGHPIAFATPMVAEQLGKRWISIALQPSVMLSAFDPSSVSGVPVLDRFRAWGPGFWRQFWRLARRVARDWGAPINDLRRKKGLRERANPILDDMFHVLTLRDTGVVFPRFGIAATGLAGEDFGYGISVLRQADAWAGFERRTGPLSRGGVTASGVYPWILGGIRCRAVLYGEYGGSKGAGLPRGVAGGQ